MPILRGIQQGVWKQTFPALQSEQRFLLQTEYTDRALGYMMRRLRRARIFDKALVIVLADHGVSFRHLQPRRYPTPKNLQDIAFVPLFVKLPHQHAARIDDGLARTIDVVPTIARYLHLRIPYHVDGKPLIGRRLPKDGTVSLLVGNGKYATARLSDLQALRRQALAEQLATFGTSRADLYRIGPHQELLGRLVSSCAGSAWTSSYSAIPIGLFPSRSAYSATTLFLLLQSKRPIVGASSGALICRSTAVR